MDTRRAFFEGRAAEWDEMMPPDLAEQLQKMLLPWQSVLSQARTILEIGTGTGALIPHIRASTQSARLFSLDLAYQMLDCARKKELNACFLEADGHYLPLKTGIFEVVICHNVFPHFRKKAYALAEIGRVLWKKGHLLILHNNSREKVNAIHRNVGGAVACDILPSDEEMRYLLEITGYTKINIKDTPESFMVSAQWFKST